MVRRRPYPEDGSEQRPKPRRKKPVVIVPPPTDTPEGQPKEEIPTQGDLALRRAQSTATSAFNASLYGGVIGAVLGCLGGPAGCAAGAQAGFAYGSAAGALAAGAAGGAGLVAEQIAYDEKNPKEAQKWGDTFEIFGGIAAAGAGARTGYKEVIGTQPRTVPITRRPALSQIDTRRLFSASSAPPSSSSSGASSTPRSSASSGASRAELQRRSRPIVGTPTSPSVTQPTTIKLGKQPMYGAFEQKVDQSLQKLAKKVTPTKAQLYRAKKNAMLARQSLSTLRERITPNAETLQNTKANLSKMKNKAMAAKENMTALSQRLTPSDETMQKTMQLMGGRRAGPRRRNDSTMRNLEGMMESLGGTMAKKLKKIKKQPTPVTTTTPTQWPTNHPKLTNLRIRRLNKTNERVKRSLKMKVKRNKLAQLRVVTEAETKQLASESGLTREEVQSILDYLAQHKQPPPPSALTSQASTSTSVARKKNNMTNALYKLTPELYEKFMSRLNPVKKFLSESETVKHITKVADKALAKVVPGYGTVKAVGKDVVKIVKQATAVKPPKAPTPPPVMDGNKKQIKGPKLLHLSYDVPIGENKSKPLRPVGQYQGKPPKPTIPQPPPSPPVTQTASTSKARSSKKDDQPFPVKVNKDTIPTEKTKHFTLETTLNRVKAKTTISEEEMKKLGDKNPFAGKPRPDIDFTRRISLEAEPPTKKEFREKIDPMIQDKPVKMKEIEMAPAPVLTGPDKKLNDIALKEKGTLTQEDREQLEILKGRLIKKYQKKPEELQDKLDTIDSLVSDYEKTLMEGVETFKEQKSIAPVTSSSRTRQKPKPINTAVGSNGGGGGTKSSSSSSSTITPKTPPETKPKKKSPESPKNMEVDETPPIESITQMPQQSEFSFRSKQNINPIIQESIPKEGHGPWMQELPGYVGPITTRKRSVSSIPEPMKDTDFKTEVKTRRGDLLTSPKQAELERRLSKQYPKDEADVRRLRMMDVVILKLTDAKDIMKYNTEAAVIYNKMSPLAKALYKFKKVQDKLNEAYMSKTMSPTTQTAKLNQLLAEKEQLQRELKQLSNK